MQSDRFLDAVTLLTRTRRGVRGLVERRSRTLWHLLNLPAGSDVRRLREQLVDLDRQLSAVHAQLDALTPPPAAGPPHDPPPHPPAAPEPPDPPPLEAAHGARRPDPARRGAPGAPRSRARRAADP